MKRKWFGRVFEGKQVGAGQPLCYLRRMTPEDIQKHRTTEVGTPVGIFNGENLLATVDFDDLFDEDGNRFYND
jgi:hypothetical protein